MIITNVSQLAFLTATDAKNTVKTEVSSSLFAYIFKNARLPHEDMSTGGLLIQRLQKY